MFFYEYTVKDHLGNARVNFRANGAAIANIEDHHYYPFGMKMEGIGSSTVTNKYTYNDKELNEDFGLNWHDYGARWYDAAIGRWWSVDPMAEQYVGWSAYNYGLGNPVKFIDRDGLEPIKPLVGTIDQAISQFKALNLNTVAQIRNFYANPVDKDGNRLRQYVRYIHTEENGWIDMRHFFAAADIGETAMDLGELVQCAGGLASCFSYEDLPSNRFGGESSNALKETIVSIYDLPNTPSEDGGTISLESTRFREGNNLFNALDNIFSNAGATAPEAAPNYANLPNRERQKIPDGHWSVSAGGERRFESYSNQKKAELIQTGKYVPQNFSDSKIDLTNFPKPAKGY